MTAEEFILTQPEDRQALMLTLHQAIIANDATVTPVIKTMMGKEMILYEERGYMKYGLASVKKYLSVHCLPMYMNAPLYTKFVALAPKAAFQKGCINFTNADELPPETLAEIIATCAPISIAALLEARKKKK